MKTYTQTKPYDFTIPAGGGITLPVQGTFYKILTSTGSIEVRRNGSSAIPLIAGQGERDVEFDTLRLTNLTGGSVSGTILIGDSNFIDDTVQFSTAISINYEQPNATPFASNTLLSANTAETVITPAGNTSGLLLLTAGMMTYSGAAAQGVLVAHTSAPANVTTGRVLLLSSWASSSAAMPTQLAKVERIPAGQGLYFITNVNEAAPSYRHASWKTL